MQPTKSKEITKITGQNGNNLTLKYFLKNIQKISDFQRVLLKNKKENLNTLAVNYQFTHEYKKIEFNDEMNSTLFGEVYDEDQTVSDKSRFIEQENKIIISSDLNKFGTFNLSYALTNWRNNYKVYNELNPGEIIYGLELDQSNFSINWV